MSPFRTVPLLGTLAFSTLTFGLAHAGSLNVAEGTVTVTDAVTPISGGFQYNYTVADGTGQLLVLDIAVSPGIAISGITAPGGSNAFTSAITTTGTGPSEEEFVSFLENNAVFTATPESGFIFDSPDPAGPSTFGVTLVDGNIGTAGGITAPIPEPAPLALTVFGAAILLFLRKRVSASHP